MVPVGSELHLVTSFPRRSGMSNPIKYTISVPRRRPYDGASRKTPATRIRVKSRLVRLRAIAFGMLWSETESQIAGYQQLPSLAYWYLTYILTRT